MRQFARWALPPTAWLTFTLALIAFASGSRWWWLFLVVLALMALAGWLDRPARAHAWRKQERAQRRRDDDARRAIIDATLIVRAEQARIRAEQMPGLDMKDKWPL